MNEGKKPRATYAPADLSSVKTYALEARPTKVAHGDFAKPLGADAPLSAFAASLPDVLKAQELLAVVDTIVTAARRDKPVVVGMGGHVVKCGLNPLIIHLMEQGVVTAVAMNGGASIHDFEIASIGRTSEDVAVELETGLFGMVAETGDAMNAAIAAGAEAELGMGRALGKRLLTGAAPHADLSILAAGARLDIPVTIHAAIGGETIHMHASADGSALGNTSFTDFRLLVSVLMDLGDGGVYINLGSAVILPEVFLKALNLARNLSDGDVTDFTTVNMDMLQHYRPTENVVRRPTLPGGNGYALTGHHEIMVPLLVNLVLARLTEST